VKARNIDLIIAQFDKLSDDAVVPQRVTARILNTSPWTIKRNRLLPEIQISERFRGNRVGDIRAVARGKPVSA
jgi:hypothetical protein